MQIKLTFMLPNKITIPIAYQHSVQALIYAALEKGDTSYSSFLHNVGYQSDSSISKLFCFGLIHGKASFIPPHITYENSICVEIRSPLEELYKVLLDGLNSSDLWELNGNPLILTKIETTEYKVTNDNIKIKMDSPLCAHITYYESDKRKTLFLNPMNHEILSLLNQNLKNKYVSAYGIEPDSKIDFKCSNLNSSDKFVTSFKNKIRITAWNGIFELSGKKELLTFLYDAGLGTRNAQGFGLFNIVE